MVMTHSLSLAVSRMMTHPLSLATSRKMTHPLSLAMSKMTITHSLNLSLLTLVM